jgi:hypothetical protein
MIFYWHEGKYNFVLFLLAIVLSVLLRYTDSDYPFDIFKLFLWLRTKIWNFHIFRVFLLHSGNLHYYYFCYFQNSQEPTFDICSSSPIGIMLNQLIIGTFFTPNSEIWAHRTS